MKDKFKRFDIILVDFGNSAIGSEQTGIRPAVIIQNDIGNTHSPTTIVMPLTTHIKRLAQPTHALLGKGADKGLLQDSMVLGECLRQISKKRIVRYLGKITDSKEKSEIRRVYDANFVE